MSKRDAAKYQGGGFFPGVPARDLTKDELKAAIDALEAQRSADDKRSGEEILGSLYQIASSKTTSNKSKDGE